MAANVHIGATPIHQVLVGDGTVVVHVIAGPEVFDDPDFSVNPAITGTAIETQTLTSDDGTAVGTEPFTYAYRWLRDGVEIELPPEFIGVPVLELA